MTTTDKQPRQANPRWLRILLLPALITASMGILLSSWALSTAPGGVPDDTFHQSLIWCAWGESETCVDSGTDEGYLVPTEVGAFTCFIRKPNLSATCAYANGDELAPSMGLKAYGIQRSLDFTMPYHRFMRLFVGTDAERSVVILRLVNAWIGALVLGFTLAVLRPGLRRAVALAWLVCLVPIGTFIIPSANPNSWTIIGLGTFWALFLGWITAKNLNSPRAWLALAGAILTGGMALLARSDGALFLGMAVIAVAILALPTLRQHKLRSLVFIAPLPLVIWGISLKVWPRLQLGLQTLFNGAPQETDTPPIPGLNQWVNHALELPTMIMGVVGGPQSSSPWPTQYYLGLGYLDTAIPTITSIFCAAALTAVLFWGLSRTNVRKLIALAVLTLGLAATIFAAIAPSGFTSGNLQARYLLPLVLTIVGIACLIEPWRRAQLNRTQAALLVMGLSIANAAVLLSNTRRYTNGESIPYFNLSASPQWWWEIPATTPLVTWATGTVAATTYFLALVAIARINRKARNAKPRPFV